MTSLLLAVIYLAFISLGLPDALLGSAWPIMHQNMNVPLSYAGVLTMLIAGATIISSLMSSRVIRALGTGLVTTLSVAMTAVALFGYAHSGSFAALCLWALPYGLGAGSVDAALNNFVATHYQSRHMNWLHCFWGVGASLGPAIMGLCLTRQLPWSAGYQTIGYLQVGLVAVLALSLPLWKKSQMEWKTPPRAAGHPVRGLRDGFRLPGVWPTLLSFFCYCALETTAGLWASSYMVNQRGIPAQTAAGLASLFYLGITGGRFVSGFLAIRFKNRQMVRLGILMIGLGIGALWLPLGTVGMTAGLLLVGVGCAPIFPGLLHETPEHFGSEHSQMLMGLQMACAYAGSTLTPVVFGWVAQKTSLAIFPFFLLAFLGLITVMTERVHQILAVPACQTAEAVPETEG